MSQVGIQVAGYCFDNFHIDAANRRLWRAGRPVALNSKYFDVLLLLVSRAGQLVEKARIFEEVWAGVFVTDAALTQCIKDIRKQLGDDATNPRYIKTIPKHGYVFIGQAVEAAADAMPGAQTASLLSPQSSHAASSGALDAEPAVSALSPPRPYKFLDYYTEQDARLFFGRESEVETVCSQILARRSFILHGRSGVGKSSLLRAGLMPRLKASGHHVFVIRSFTDPLHQMTAALVELLQLDKGDADEADLRALLQRTGARAPGRLVIFFLDQFEEFFTLLADDTRKHFLDTIAALIACEGLPFRLVFALREDMLAEMSQLKTAIPEIFHHEYRLKRLSREQAALAITEPARAVGCRYEPLLVTRLLDDLSDQNGVDPPQLQIVCDNLYDSRNGDCELTLAVYERLGGASQILAGYLERVLRRFDATDLQIVKEILTALISVDGQRLVLRATDVCARLRNAPERVVRLIEELVVARVARRRRQDGEAWLELAHDFLTPEVSRWLTADEMALKRARGIIERAMENYHAHQLLIDADALDLLHPFGEPLGLTGAEANLLLMSLLNRARTAPEWLIHAAPSSSRLIQDASASVDSEIRFCAVDAAAVLRGAEMQSLLRRLALWDENLMVRKAASIALADWLGPQAEAILSTDAEGETVGLVRRAVTLAMMRDYDKPLVKLSHQSIAVSLLVIGGLMWVRLRRRGSEMARQSMGGMLGGGASGFIGGALLSVSLGIARHAPLVNALETLIVLVALGSFVGAIAGLGVSFGMIAASRIAYRHSRWWSVVGGAAGGAMIGGSSKLLGMDTVKALFGQIPTGITGAFEGAVIGVGVALGAVLVAALWPRARSWQKVFGASLGAMCAGVLLTVIGGNLFSGSLEIVARLFANSQMRMDALAPLFGEVHFGQTTQIILGAMEGLLFGAGMTSGIEYYARRKIEQASDTR